MDRLNLNALRVFAMAARHGSFQQAAAMLHVSHGAVSQRIRQLEDDLGVILFERSSRGVVLTHGGRDYHAAVEEALAILATATGRLTGGQSGAENRVTLHVGASFLSKWLMPRMEDFARACPGVSLATQIHDALPAHPRPLGRSEIAIWPGPDEMQANGMQAPGRHLRRLCDLRIVAVCQPGLVGPGSAGPGDVRALLSHRLLQDANRRWERLIARTGHPGPHVILDFDRSALAIEAAVQGHGVALAPDVMTARDVRAGRLAEIWRDPVHSGECYWLAWSAEAAPSRPLRRAITWILSEFGLDTGI